MINVKELRIGNLVQYNLYASPSTIIGISKDRIDLEPLNKADSLPIVCSLMNKGLKKLQPIPLTEKWLIKLGFKGRNDFVYKYDGVGVKIENGKYLVSLKDISNVFFHSIVEVKHVHTLQNLYFTLTQKELLS